MKFYRFIYLSFLDLDKPPKIRQGNDYGKLISKTGEDLCDVDGTAQIRRESLDVGGNRWAAPNVERKKRYCWHATKSVLKSNLPANLEF